MHIFNFPKLTVQLATFMERRSSPTNTSLVTRPPSPSRLYKVKTAKSLPLPRVCTKPNATRRNGNCHHKGLQAPPYDWDWFCLFHLRFILPLSCPQLIYISAVESGHSRTWYPRAVKEFPMASGVENPRQIMGSRSQTTTPQEKTSESKARDPI